MTLFVIGAGVFLAIAAVLATWPLLRRDASRGDEQLRDEAARDGALRRAAHRAEPALDDRRAMNVELYRQRLAEIARDRDAGILTATDAAAMEREAAATLLDDAPPNDASTISRGPGAWAAVVVVVAIVGLSVTLYRHLGAYEAVQLGDAMNVLRDADADPAALGDFVKRLRARVATKPDDGESWYLLGHTLMRLDDASGAVGAFERVYALQGDDPAVQVALAQARFVADGGTISADNRALLDRILADDPRQAVALEILALDAFRRADYPATARYLESALSGGMAGPRAAALQEGLKRARAMIGDAGPGLDVTVELGDAVRGLPPTAALFVYARRPGERMPLLVARRPIDGASITVRLDAANAMQGDVTLAAGDVVDVAARVSASGNVTPGANDPQAHRPGVALSGGVTPVRLELGPAPTVAAAPAPSPAAAPLSAPTTAPTGNAEVRVSVSLAPGVAAVPPARVFVIARAPNGPPMPIAVRALDPTTLPQQLVLTDRDAMQPSRVLSMFERVEVVARLSRSGDPIRQPGDLESPTQLIDPRTAPTAALVIGG
jgi:cytochrome c-type biogenesis protein CcmH